MLPFNTGAFSNTLGATDRAAERKALVAPLKEEFDGKAEDVLQHIAVLINDVMKPESLKTSPSLKKNILLHLTLT
jgi:hypothetical protein